MSKKIIALIFFSINLFAQSGEVIEQLKLIEAGKIEQVKSWLGKVQRDKNFDDPSVIIIDALLTENAAEAINRYEDFQRNYPKNSLSQLALFKLYSYYYSVGVYTKAKDYALQLKKRFPDSSYLKNINEVYLKNEKIELQISETNTDAGQIEQKQENIKEKFSIQVGAFANINNAKQLLKRIKSKKYKADLIVKNINGKDFHVVMVGNYQTLDEAMKAQYVINKDFNLDSKIIKISE
jgi:hypothetical protein